jgi:hypothetical protein
MHTNSKKETPPTSFNEVGRAVELVSAGLNIALRLLAFLCPPPFRPACPLCSRDSSAGSWRHRPLASGDGNNFLSLGLRPSRALSSGHSCPRYRSSLVACSVQCRECVIEIFKLRRETVPFLLQLIEYRSEIDHGRNCNRCVRAALISLMDKTNLGPPSAVEAFLSVLWGWAGPT